MKDWEVGGLRVMSKMIAKRALDSSFTYRDDTFQDELRIRRNQGADGLRSNHRGSLTAKETRKADLIDVFRQWKYCSHHENGICTDHDGDFEIFSFLFRFPIVPSSSLHALPVHAGHVFAEHLQPVQPQIPPLCARMMRQDHAVSDEPSSVTRPAFENGQL